MAQSHNNMKWILFHLLSVIPFPSANNDAIFCQTIKEKEIRNGIKDGGFSLSGIGKYMTSIAAKKKRNEGKGVWRKWLEVFLKERDSSKKKRSWIKIRGDMLFGSAPRDINLELDCKVPLSRNRTDLKWENESAGSFFPKSICYGIVSWYTPL